MALERLREPKDKTITDLLWRFAEERGLKRTEQTSVERGWWTTQPGEGLHASGMTLPDGAKLRSRYRAKFFLATVEEAKICFAGRKYDSPSGAARAVLAQQRVRGAAGNVNGWKFWEMECPTDSGQWKRLDSFRKPWQVKRHRW